MRAPAGAWRGKRKASSGIQARLRSRDGLGLAQGLPGVEASFRIGAVADSPLAGGAQRPRRILPRPSRSQSSEMFSSIASRMRKSVCGVVPFS